MANFYEGLASGLSRHEAFKQAQLLVKLWAEKKVNDDRSSLKALYEDNPREMNQELKAILPPEYYWAAFVLLD